MKLYTYDHCPFCVRARMILGLHRINFTHEILLNDDEATPNALIGKKMVPILEKADGTAMGESLDIVAYIENQAAEPLLTAAVRDNIKDWTQSMGQNLNRLVMPRLIKLGLPEFATDSAIQYFIHKKTDYIGDFAENLANTANLIPTINQALHTLAPHIQSPEALNGTLGYEDIYVFPALRSLSCVKNIDWPEAVKQYTDTMSKQTGIPLFTDKAI